MIIIKQIITTTIIMLTLDAIWLGVIAKNLYVQEMGNLLSKNPNLIAAAIVYALMISGIMIFVLPKAQNNPLIALGFGSLFGFICYGIYDFTNLAVINNWTLLISIVDLVWGSILCGVTSYLVALLFK
jgi:uncharacterized membrane protein